MISREGEQVLFLHPIEVKEDTSVHSWLSGVEDQMRRTLASFLSDAVTEDRQLSQWVSRELSLGQKESEVASERESRFVRWLEKYPAQIVLLASQVAWCEQVEAALSKANGDGAVAMSALQEIEAGVQESLKILSDHILHDLPPDRRKKFEQLITEKVHQRDVTRQLIKSQVKTATDFTWLYYMRYYFNST